ncbi:hypothetical protein BAE44_0000899 [Dichanthelium oligosanthes]|uniref:Late embryogenesis abundant protein LEA-2 subgroup domain-containing protein n=1 Tax=Dichanthelium oligosanthes TaxID=888268 RepID=A0A1E5WKX8_9POAL|nr:hypothetical protein BAE44_0000899 [Dichanthelium oligosanthes]
MAQRWRKMRPSEIQKILYALLALALAPFVYYLLVHLPPKFSVQLTGIQGLDTAAPAAALSTIFNITLHASNKRGGAACYRHGEAVVRYSGFTLAWGRTRTFCVGAKGTRDVPIVAWADGVGLPKLIRDRMAAERRAGTVELEVDVKLFAEGDNSGAEPTWMWCKVATGGKAEPASDATPCSVFGSRIWASDFAPAWMLV